MNPRCKRCNVRFAFPDEAPELCGLCVDRIWRRKWIPKLIWPCAAMFLAVFPARLLGEGWCVAALILWALLFLFIVGDTEWQNDEVARWPDDDGLEDER